MSGVIACQLVVDIAAPVLRTRMLRRILPTAERTVSPGQQPKVIDKGGAIRERPLMASTIWRFARLGRLRSYVRPHMGAVCQATSFPFPSFSAQDARAGVIQGGAPIIAGSPANLTSGGIAFPPRSRIRDGGAPRRRHHSLRRCISTRPDNDDAPLNPYPGAVRLGINFGRRSRCGLHHRTFRHHALCGEPPQGDQ